MAAWLAVGAFLYLKLFARKAGVADVSAQVRDPLLLQYRGKNPLVMGLTHFSGEETENRLEMLMNAVDCDVVVLKAPEGWRLSGVKKVLVPAGGKSVNYMLRTRIPGSLWRMNKPEIAFMRILPKHLKTEDVKHAWHQLVDVAGEEAPDIPRIMVVQNDSVEEAVLEEAARSDLLVMGLQHSGRRRRRFGELTLNIARKAECAVVLISKGFS